MTRFLMRQQKCPIVEELLLFFVCRGRGCAPEK